MPFTYQRSLLSIRLHRFRLRFFFFGSCIDSAAAGVDDAGADGAADVTDVDEAGADKSAMSWSGSGELQYLII